MLAPEAELSVVEPSGGAEFAITARTLDINALGAALKDAVVTVARPFCGNYALTMSVGHASTPETGSSAEELLAVADRAMYDCKRRRYQGHPKLQLVASA